MTVVSRTRSFSYDIVAAGHAHDAWPLLTEYSKHAALHPFIVNVEKLPTADGSLRSYRITDRLRLGPIPFRVRYLTDVLEVDAARVVTVARQRPRTIVKNETELVDGADGTVHAHTTVTMTAPLLLFGYAFRQLRIAHEGLAVRLREEIERVAREGAEGGDQAA